MIQLPKELETKLRHEMDKFEEEQEMPYVTSFERLAKEETFRESLGLYLEGRFGAAGKKLLPKLEAFDDVKQLRALTLAIAKADTLDEVKRLLS